MPFTTRDKVKRALRIPTTDTDHDEAIDELISAVHSIILADIGGGLTRAEPMSYTQKFDILRSGLTGIRLPKWPVTAVTEVRTGTEQGATGSALATTDYYVTPEGTLRLQGGTFPYGVQNAQVTWTAGITAGSKDERSLELAERLSVAMLFNTTPGLGKSSERIGSYSYTIADRDQQGEFAYPPIAEKIVGRYRSVFASDPVVP